MLLLSAIVLTALACGSPSASRDPASRDPSERSPSVTLPDLAHPEQLMQGRREEPFAAAAERERRRFRHRFESSVSHETFSLSVPAARAINLSTSVSLSETWLPRPDLELSLDALTGVGNEVLPTFQADGRVAWTRGRAEVATRVRHLQFGFPQTAVWITSPEVTFWVSDRLAVSGRYSRRFTTHRGPLRPISDNSEMLRSHLRVRDGVWVDLGYARGVESFDEASPDRPGRFQAHTVLAGSRIDLSRQMAVNVNAERQARSTGLRVMQISVGIVQRF
jgi:hypothetical protein